MSVFIMGLDIGYSNLVIACGETGTGAPERVITLPAGAAPAERMPRTLSGAISLESGTLVQIDGESWAAGVEPDSISGLTRQLHEDYPSTDAYKALFYSALLTAERDVIDLLVTGLPVNQFYDKESVGRLTKLLKGTHQVTPKRAVTVKKLLVVPQPVGTFMSTLWYEPDGSTLARDIQRGNTIVIDPGFFSVDWVSFRQAKVRGSSGTDLRAMSEVLSTMAAYIQADYGSDPTIDRLETAIRNGDKDILFMGSNIEIGDYFMKAVRKVSKDALQPLQNDIRLRGGASNIDVVLMGGGGAHAYKDAAAEIFPHAQVVCPDEAVETNARGFWAAGDSREI